MVLSFLWGTGWSVVAFSWTSVFHPFALPFIAIGLAVQRVALPVVVASVCCELILRCRSRDARLFYPWILVACMLGMESLRTFRHLPFPYTSPAALLAPWSASWPIVRLGGEWLVSALVFAINAAVAALCLVPAALRAQRQVTGSSQSIRELRALRPTLMGVFAAVVVVIVALAGQGSAVTSSGPTSTLRVGLAQDTFEPRQRWAEEWESHLDQMAAQARLLPTADLVVYSEGSIETSVSLDSPDQYALGTRVLNRASAIAREGQVGLFVSAIEASAVADGERLFNTLLYFDSSGTLASIYRKQRLAPFGEFNPFARLWPRGGEVLTESSGALMLEPGRRPGIVPLSDGTTVGVLTCFESAFPGMARELVRGGASLLVNVSNDGWTNSAIAMRQHANHAILRSVETNLPMIRVSNGGISFSLDPRTGEYQELPMFASDARTVSVVRRTHPSNTEATAPRMD